MINKFFKERTDHLKEEDSELWFEEKKLHTISIEQSTYQNLFQISGLWRILFHNKSGLRRLSFILKNLLLNHSDMYLIWNCLFFYQFIDNENDSREAFKRSAPVDIIWITGRDRQCGANDFDKPESLSKTFICGVSTQQWPSTQITLFVKTRQSAWLDAVMIPLTRSKWILVY